MLYLSFLLLGAVASRAVRISGLLAIVALLAVAIGLEGALNQRDPASVLGHAVLMLAAVEISYLATSWLWDAAARPRPHGEIGSGEEPATPRPFGPSLPGEPREL